MELLLKPETGLKKRSRQITLVLLLAILLVGGIFTESIYHAFDVFYHFLFTQLGFQSFIDQSQQGVSNQLTKRNWLSVLTYGLLFVGICFVILHLYFNNRAKTKITAGFYLVLFAFCFVLVVAGKFVPGFGWAHMLCRRLMEFIVSPFPIILLAATLKNIKIPGKTNKA